MMSDVMYYCLIHMMMMVDVDGYLYGMMVDGYIVGDDMMDGYWYCIDGGNHSLNDAYVALEMTNPVYICMLVEFIRKKFLFLFC